MRVTLVGRGPSWVDCPFDTLDIWGTATCLITPGMSDKKFTKVFAFDDDDRNHEAAKVALERNIPLVSPFPFATERWPSREIVEEFRSSYFLNTMSRMIAYAIYQKFTRLHIHGIDQGPSWGLQQARTHVCFWVGYAMGRGLDVRLGRGSLAWTYQIPEKPDTQAIQEPEELSLKAALCE